MVRGYAVGIILLILLAGCTSPPADPADDPPSSASGEIGSAGNRTSGANGGAPAANTAVAPKVLHRMAPWTGDEEILVFEGRAPLSLCPERFEDDEFGIEATARVICRNGSLGVDSRIPPGTASLRLTVTDAEAATPAGCDALPSCGVLGALLVTQRGEQLVGEKLESPPYEWHFDLGDDGRPEGAWNLPDHVSSGYMLRIVSSYPAIPDDPASPLEGASVEVTLYAIRHPDWQPIEIIDMYSVEDDLTVAPGVRLLTEEALTLKARAGVLRTPTVVGVEEGAYLPVGTGEVAVITRWSTPAGCPSSGPCVPWVWVINGKITGELKITQAAERGDGWAIYSFYPNLENGYMWSELDGTNPFNKIAVDPVHCIEIELNPCLRPAQATYTADYELETIVTVETWNRTVDLAAIKMRYGLES